MWDLIDAKTELIKVGNDLLGRWRDWRASKVWRDRTERIEAAHTVLVVTAFFEAVKYSGLKLQFSKGEQERLAKLDQNDSARLLTVPGCPSAQVSYEETLDALEKYYSRLSGQLTRFIQGLAIWESLPEHKRDRYSESALSLAALRCYKDKYRQLAMDVPEFAFWSSMVDHQATRASLGELERLLSKIATSEVLDVQLQSLARLHRAALDRPIAETGDVPMGMVLPALADAYITPNFLAKEAGPRHNPSLEEWWETCRLRADFTSFLASFLTGSAASRVPLVVLGQPGAGKSVLTKVLAARLPAQFLPVRVPLREVHAGADIQEQIEQAIYRLSGERLEWPALARAAKGVLPVVFLDGFDELLQATGVRQSDYLKQVAQFQQRELDAGRAVAVIVTSRTAVADRAEFPEGTIVVRLEPFDDAQVRNWLSIWNEANAPYFKSSQIEPFTWDVALSQIELARQPLLLMMLAFYDADGNALRRGVKELGRVELYEQLMRRFAKRELEKEFPDDQVSVQVDKELFRLSIIAFAMFNRGRQWATGGEVDADLAVLSPPIIRPASFNSPLTASEEAFGRFFFVHQAQAVRDGDMLLTYEFLHATFGEFLIARLVATLLHELVAQERTFIGTNDGLLGALLSWATLSNRTPVLNFLSELIKESARCKALIARLLQGIDSHRYSEYASYEPLRGGPARRHAYYSANLFMLGLAAGMKRASEIMLRDADILAEWRKFTFLWRSQCTPTDWLGLVRAVATYPLNLEGGRFDLHLGLTPLGEFAWGEVDSVWISKLDLSATDLLQQAAFCCSEEVLHLHAVEPLRHLVLVQEEKGLTKYALRTVLEILALRHGAQADRIAAYQAVASVFDEIEASVPLKAVLGDLSMLDPDDVHVLLEEVAAKSPISRRLVDFVVRHGLKRR
ncbi:hypothetical protein KLK06_40360 [Nonomuraea sp. NEAU-A123]|nr:hypothetical protein [Nonomuraea sp. NEAU-A123]MBT2232121.1 hypothetical protein [Nonomuraea sp. NEAU-A123]